MTDEKLRVYSADDIDVTYSLQRCIHAAECVSRLNAVFNPQQRPWIQPVNATADNIAATVEHCPTGALHHTRKDGGAAEVPDASATIRIQADGPHYIRGKVVITDAEGNPVREEARLALCRCGASNNKPFCDNSHKMVGFSATDNLAANSAKASEYTADAGALIITPMVDGALKIVGNFTLIGVDGQTVFKGREAALCRCGGSANKPFCDGTHAHIGFTAP